MNAFDLQVLCTLGRLARGMSFILHYGGTLHMRGEVPEHLLYIEYDKHPQAGELGGSLLVLRDCGYIDPPMREWWTLPDEECEYESITGKKYFLRNKPIKGNPYVPDGTPQFDIRRADELHGFWSGLAQVYWFKVTAEGWKRIAEAESAAPPARKATPKARLGTEEVASPRKRQASHIEQMTRAYGLHCQDKSYQQIADELKISKGWAYALVRKAKKAIDQEPQPRSVNLRKAVPIDNRRW